MNILVHQGLCITTSTCSLSALSACTDYCESHKYGTSEVLDTEITLLDNNLSFLAFSFLMKNQADPYSLMQLNSSEYLSHDQCSVWTLASPSYLQNFVNSKKPKVIGKIIEVLGEKGNSKRKLKLFFFQKKFISLSHLPSSCICFNFYWKEYWLLFNWKKKKSFKMYREKGNAPFTWTKRNTSLKSTIVFCANILLFYFSLEFSLPIP